MLTDRALLSLAGQKIKQIRLAKQLSQQELSKRSGLSVFSISQIENGSNTSFLSLLALLRAMGKLDMISSFWADEPINPIALADYAKAHPQPKRVSSAKAGNKSNNTESEW